MSIQQKLKSDLSKFGVYLGDGLTTLLGEKICQYGFSAGVDQNSTIFGTPPTVCYVVIFLHLAESENVVWLHLIKIVVTP